MLPGNWIHIMISNSSDNEQKSSLKMMNAEKTIIHILSQSNKVSTLVTKQCLIVDKHFSFR